VTVHYVGQYSDRQFDFRIPPRKIREWTTVDLILNYTLNLPVVNPQAEVPGGIQGSSKDAIASASSARNIVSTANFRPGAWPGASTTRQLLWASITYLIPLHPASLPTWKTATTKALPILKDELGSSRLKNDSDFV
jgi:hypothetical protein